MLPTAWKKSMNHQPRLGSNAALALPARLGLAASIEIRAKVARSKVHLVTLATGC